MADRNFDIKVDSSSATGVLGELTVKLQGLNTLHQQLAEMVEGKLALSFDTESDPTGKAWKALAPSTIAVRRRKGLVPIKKLQATGRGKRGINVVIIKTGIRVEVGGDNTDYMEFHETGSRIMPQRRFVPTEDELRDEIEAIVTAYLTPSIGGFVRGEIARTPILRRLLR
jgi:phage gpG-like protein